MNKDKYVFVQLIEFLDNNKFRHLVRNYDVICLEDLNVKGMEQNHQLTRAIQGAGWSEFVRQLEYKSEFFEKNVLFIGRFEPSSKLCHKCG